MTGVFFIQQNFTVGAVEENADKLAEGARQAAAAGADVALAPEMALVGYPAEDLLYSSVLRQRVEQAVAQLAASLPPNIALVAGIPHWRDGALYNACALMRGGRTEAIYEKAHLPNSSVFDEKRYFTESPNPPLTFTAGGARYAVQICQDIWEPTQVQRLAATCAQTSDGANIDAILVPNGSPFVVGKHTQRLQIAADLAQRANATVHYAHSIGGQDELVFDGASFTIAPDGTLIGQLPAFTAVNSAATAITPYPDDIDAIYTALTLGLSDYLKKSRFAKKVILGLSGGVDSALVAALAADALGADRVVAVMMATEYTSQASLEDAAALAANLGIEYQQLPLTPAVQAVANTLNPQLRARDGDLTKENLQARLRGTLLMALANNRDLLLLATGNKSEYACGYATLYGDMCGGFAPIKDVLKTQVWQLCHHFNARHNNAIPERIITRPPSAELRPNQTDDQSLPPYPVLDAIIQDHLAHRPQSEIAAAHGAQEVADFYRRLTSSEYKRRQAPPGTKISECAFGRDWRMPIASAFTHAQA